jgi:AraC-like DNA-binding protein
MWLPVKINLCQLMQELADAHQLQAQAEGIGIVIFNPGDLPEQVFDADPLRHDISHLIQGLLEFLPDGNTITLSVENFLAHSCDVVITATGIDLSIYTGMIKVCQLPITINPQRKPLTVYRINLKLAELPTEETGSIPISLDGHAMNFFAEVKQRLQSHFSKTESLVHSLQQRSPRDATFLTRVNELILSNLGNPEFDANHLAEAMNMSRTQLFRRLKPIIKQSTGVYIRTIKLQKAKELLETTDLRIGEVAYKTGFESASHFTKVFTQKYGLNPSMVGKPR